ncbi:ATP-binding cassette domain-containing protein [Streptomyces sp. NPDC086023]|uniref:ATP-binding cassette domain-containing protein n=1 Tax=Streptomyces sp. NPDC086023 TaxID=3365746 RepID=UPI0037CD2C85
MLQAIGLTSAPRKDLPPAVDDLTFEACPGRVTALLGEPGAGKTTALRLMLELEPGRGVTYFRGRPLHRIPHPAREVGVLLGDVPGHPARTVRGQLRMLCAAVGVPASRADTMMEVVGISGLRDQRLGSLSLGMDRRVGLASALLADPCTLLLDEPSAGLSPRDQSWLYRLLRGHAELGGAVLFTTSDAKEAARSADRVVSIAGGRLVADQEAADFARTRLRPRVAVRTPHAARLAALLSREARAAQKSVEIVEESGSRLSVYGSSCAEVGETAFRHGVLVHQLADETGDSGPTFPRPTPTRDHPSARPTPAADSAPVPAAADAAAPHHAAGDPAARLAETAGPESYSGAADGRAPRPAAAGGPAPHSATAGGRAPRPAAAGAPETRSVAAGDMTPRAPETAGAEPRSAAACGMPPLPPATVDSDAAAAAHTPPPGAPQAVATSTDRSAPDSAAPRHLSASSSATDPDSGRTPARTGSPDARQAPAPVADGHPHIQPTGPEGASAAVSAAGRGYGAASASGVGPESGHTSASEAGAGDASASAPAIGRGRAPASASPDDSHASGPDPRPGTAGAPAPLNGQGRASAPGTAPGVGSAPTPGHYDMQGPVHGQGSVPAPGSGATRASSAMPAAGQGAVRGLATGQGQCAGPVPGAGIVPAPGHGDGPGAVWAPGAGGMAAPGADGAADTARAGAGLVPPVAPGARFARTAVAQSDSGSFRGSGRGPEADPDLGAQGRAGSLGVGVGAPEPGVLGSVRASEPGPDSLHHREAGRAAAPGIVHAADGGFLVGSGCRPVRVADPGGSGDRGAHRTAASGTDTAQRHGHVGACASGTDPGAGSGPVRAAPAEAGDRGPVRAGAPVADPARHHGHARASGSGTDTAADCRNLVADGVGPAPAAAPGAYAAAVRGTGPGADADTRPLPLRLPGAGPDVGAEPLPVRVRASEPDADARPRPVLATGPGAVADARPVPVRTAASGTDVGAQPLPRRDAAPGPDADGHPGPVPGRSGDASAVPPTAGEPAPAGGAGPVADANRHGSRGAPGVPGQGRYAAGGPRHARTGAPVSAVRRIGGPLRPWRYELRRAFGTAVVPAVTGATAVLSVLITLLLARGGHVPQTRLLAAWPSYLPLPPAALAAGLLGALAFGEEYRFPALAADRGTVPRRLGLLLAKLGVSAGLAVSLGGLAVTADAAALRLVFDTDLIRTPADWLSPAVSWAGLLVGCAWAGVLASGVFRSATAGLAAVLAVPVLVVPLVRKVFDGPSAYPVAGLSARLRGLAWAQWPPEADRLVMGALRVMAQPVGTALVLSLTVLMCAYGFTGLRSRVRW